jgi:hypothetical protein
MGLGRLQSLSYNHRVNIYRPPTMTPDPVTKAAPDRSYPDLASPTLSNVACYVYETTEIGEPQRAGRTKVFNLLTADHVWFSLDVSAHDGDVIEVLVGPDPGGFWVLDGNGQSLPSDTRMEINEQFFYIKRFDVHTRI